MVLYPNTVIEGEAVYSFPLKLGFHSNEVLQDAFGFWTPLAQHGRCLFRIHGSVLRSPYWRIHENRDIRSSQVQIDQQSHTRGLRSNYDGWLFPLQRFPGTSTKITENYQRTFLAWLSMRATSTVLSRLGASDCIILEKLFSRHHRRFLSSLSSYGWHGRASRLGWAWTKNMLSIALGPFKGTICINLLFIFLTHCCYPGSENSMNL